MRHGNCWPSYRTLWRRASVAELIWACFLSGAALSFLFIAFYIALGIMEDWRK